MKNRRASARRRIKRGHSVVLYDPFAKSLYLADVPKRNRKSFLLRMRDRAEMALNFMKTGRAFRNSDAEYVK